MSLLLRLLRLCLLLLEGRVEVESELLPSLSESCAAPVKVRDADITRSDSYEATEGNEISFADGDEIISIEEVSCLFFWSFGN